MYTQVYGITEFGTAQAIKNQDIDLKEVAAGCVRIRVISASINPIDVKTRSGLGFVAAAKAHGQFLGLGYDVYGEVVDSSPEHRDKLGLHAFGMVGFPTQPGCYASYRDAPVDELVFVDKSKANFALGGLSLAGLTALQALEKLDTCSTLYVLAPTGGVGHLAIQLAALQDKKVIAVTTRPQHAMLLKLAIKHKFKVLSYDEFFVSKVNGGCLDLVGGDVGKKVLSNFEAGSKVITIPTITKDALVEHGGQYGVQVEGVVVKADQQQLKQLGDWLETKRLDLIVEQQFCLNDVALAHQKMESGDYSGKLLIVA
jgi:NADPH2:quinone reductase